MSRLKAIPDFSKEIYLNLLKTQGLNAALTQLHKDILKWEWVAFESPQGYQPEVIEDLEEIRHFSRQLWEIEKTTL